MGSWDMFAEIPCQECRLYRVEAMWPRCSICKVCERQYWLSILRDTDYGDFGVLNTLNMPIMLLSFFMIDRRRAQRALFLRCSLLPYRCSQVSVFCQFTYARGGGSAGNISESEDILDRIFSFLFHIPLACVQEAH